ncbi:MAG: GNAT family N-acetyltransferase [Acidiferrobacterales bacterium]
MEPPAIETVTETSLEEILPLVRQYQEFYKIADISDERNRIFFSRFCVDNPLGRQFLLRHEGKAVAFATIYFSFTSSIPAKVAVLNDLYTVPEVRGRRFARRLIEHCRAFAKENGAVRLQWLTASDNYAAQKLYDSLDTSKSDWIFYTCVV